MNLRDLMRLGVMACLFGLNIALCELAAGDRALNPIEAVQFGAMIVMWGGVYIVIGSHLLHRPILRRIPQMTIANIWCLVYGLGLILFATVYCCTGVNAIAQNGFMWGIGALVADDAQIRSSKNDPILRIIALFTCAIVATAANTMSSLMDPYNTVAGQGVNEGIWSCIAGVLFVPVLAPFLYYGIREQRHYSVASVAELIQFAMPFASILSVTMLITLHTEPAAEETRIPLTKMLWNYSLISEAGADTATRLSMQMQRLPWNSYLLPLLPITILPTLFFSVQTAYLFATVDFLVPMALATAIRGVARNPTHTSCIIGIVLAIAALVGRVFVCYMDEDQESGRVFISEDVEDDLVVSEAAQVMHQPLVERENPPLPPSAKV
jgi:hypothetical protein